jgi:hypothetical protein
MDIDVAQKPLGPFLINDLKQCILDQPPEAWTEQSLRQKAYEVHKDTESIVMLFCEENWPEGDIHKDMGWDRLSETAMPIINAILEKHYPPGGILLRAMAAKLKANGQIRPHKDTLHSFHIGHRIHVPITTNPAVRFTIDGRPYSFEVGHAYELNNQKKHSVLNMSNEDRISFIFDYVPPQNLTKHSLEKL